jgi:hypothetical protein
LSNPAWDALFKKVMLEEIKYAMPAIVVPQAPNGVKVIDGTIGGMKAVVSPLLPPDKICVINSSAVDFSESMKTLAADTFKMTQEAMGHFGMDLALGESKTAVGVTSVAVPLDSSKMFDQKYIAVRLAEIGCKLLTVDFDYMIMYDMIEMVVKVEMPQGGQRYASMKFDKGALSALNTTDRYDFVATRFRDQLEGAVSMIATVGASISASPHLAHLYEGLSKQKAVLTDEITAISMNTPLHASPSLLEESGFGQAPHVDPNWVDKMSYRGLRAEYNYVEVWANQPLIQLRATLMIKKMRGLHMVKRSVIIDLEYAEGLDELMPLAVYLLNESATDVIRGYTGF